MGTFGAKEDFVEVVGIICEDPTKGDDVMGLAVLETVGAICDDTGDSKCVVAVAVLEGFEKLTVVKRELASVVVALEESVTCNKVRNHSSNSEVILTFPRTSRRFLQ
jgi:hypothetical protein